MYIDLTLLIICMYIDLTLFKEKMYDKAVWFLG
jgi:hypothetical protein